MNYRMVQTVKWFNSITAAKNCVVLWSFNKATGIWSHSISECSLIFTNIPATHFYGIAPLFCNITTKLALNYRNFKALNLTLSFIWGFSLLGFVLCGILISAKKTTSRSVHPDVCSLTRLHEQFSSCFHKHCSIFMHLGIHVDRLDIEVTRSKVRIITRLNMVENEEAHTEMAGHQCVSGYHGSPHP